jgi:hypothetical protein
MEWEGAELCYYINGESHGIDLSDTQFAIVAKILGLEINPDGSVNCFSDDTLKRFIGMDSNPLKLKKYRAGKPLLFFIIPFHNLWNASEQGAQ